ncbi:DNA replication factor Dna2-domain-containing protein [Gymnopilus junonius]|uniref:DNA helicase n=1 Tax=Gymnopilus junonius TaxID=109634 RepID=A0A9P5NVL2_GYMJU|nr:DNA replication factor Dna2-domain-containing protein [Gymnopilus junonius]
MAPTEADEAAFMNDLMQGLEDDFWTAAPTPDPSPVKKLPLRPIQPPSSPRTPTRHPKQHASETSSLNPSITSVSFSATGHDISSFLQGSENWDLDTDFFSSPVKPQKFVEVKKPSPSPPYIPDPCTRCIVESVTEEYVDSRWRKTVIAKVDPGVERVEVFLCDDWYQTDIRIDDTINTIGTFSPSKSPSTSSQTPKRSIYITSQSNFLILHPDLLLTATALSNAPQCRRKPLLSSLVRSTSDTTPSLVWGSMLHEVMQRCLLEQQWDKAFIDKCIDETVLAGLGELVKLGLSEDIAKREVKDRAMGLKGFADKYLAEEPKENGELTNTRSGAYDAPSLLAISRILDVEEEIVSPTYGIKGKLDATVQGIISDPILSSKSNPYSKPSASALERKLTHTPFPLELKTGRPGAGMEHRAQTMLYTVLLSERYGADVQDGLLFYTQSANGELIRVPRGRNEIRGLLGVRNDLVASISGPTLSHKAQSNREEPGEEPKEEEHFLPPPIDDQRACQRCYAIDTCFLFRKIHPNHNAPLIVGSAPQSLKAQKLSRKFDPPVPDFLADAFAAKTAHLTPARVEFFAKWERLLALEERDLVRFKRELWTIGAEERQKRGRCFAGMVLVPSGKGDKLEHGMSQGAEMDKDGEKDLKIEWGKEGKIHRSQPNNLLNGYMSVGDPITVSVEPKLLALARGYILELTPQREEVIFRIDKDELFGGMARVRNNLAQMFYADGDRKRLELVVDLRKPIFSAPTPPFLPSSSSASSTGPPQPPSHLSHLNPSQLSAMQKVLEAEDYALVLGMPGTGKTTVIAELIRELVRRGKSVLLSSYTHSAVDTILMKLESGRSGVAVEGDGLGGSFGILRLGNVDKVHPAVRKYTLAERRKPTTVEQYEKQLLDAPVVKNPEARKGGLDVSLFRRLSEAHPEAVVDLRFQYRMNEDIMYLSNRLIYDDRLRCGNEEVRNRALVLSDKSFLGRLHNGKEVLADERCKAVFVDTDALSATESRVGDLVQNTTEAELQQIKLLQHLLQERKGVEILTADKSQGRDKDCVIVSLVRSNDGGHIGELVKDWRRMNVSFTRARSKLVIFGSRKTLQREPLLAQFFDLMQARGWILQLQPVRPRKKAKVEMGKNVAGANAGVLKGRPILRDLVGNEV